MRTHRGGLSAMTTGGNPTVTAAAAQAAQQAAASGGSRTRASADDAITQWEIDSINAINNATETVSRNRLTMGSRAPVTRSAKIPGVGEYEIKMQYTSRGTPVYTFSVADENGRSIDDDRQYQRISSVDEGRRIARDILADRVSGRAARRRSRLDEI